jgi:O-antigen ligase
MANDLATLSTDALQQKLKTSITMQRTVMIIFGLIILGWVIPGFWRKNTPVFISTVAMAVALTTMMSATTRRLRDELRRRDTA